MVIARTLAITHCSRLKLRNPSPIAIYPTVATDSEQTMHDVGMDQWKLARMWVFIIVHHGVYISRIILQCPVDFERF